MATTCVRSLGKTCRTSILSKATWLKGSEHLASGSVKRYSEPFFFLGAFGWCCSEFVTVGVMECYEKRSDVIIRADVTDYPLVYEKPRHCFSPYVGVEIYNSVMLNGICGALFIFDQFLVCTLITVFGLLPVPSLSLPSSVFS